MAEAARRALFLAIVLGTSLLSIEQARAEGAEDARVAREHTRRGTAAYNLGHFGEAAREYEQAYRLVQDPVLLYNLAQSYRLGGDAPRALLAYKAFLRTAPADAPNREQAGRRIQELELKLAAPAPGAVVPDEAPAKPVAAPPPPPPPPSPSPAPGADAGTAAPPRALRQPAPNAVETRESAPPPAAQRTGRVLPWVSLGVTAALAGGAIATGLTVNSRFESLRSSCGQTAAGCSGDEVAGLKSRVLLTNLLWAGAGVAAVVTGVTFLVGRDEAGLALAGRF